MGTNDSKCVQKYSPKTQIVISVCQDNLKCITICKIKTKLAKNMR